MTNFLDSGFSDAFRFLYPQARGSFTYWSQRAGNRPFNKGIRLDYFIVSDNMLGMCEVYRVTRPSPFFEE